MKPPQGFQLCKGISVYFWDVLQKYFCKTNQNMQTCLSMAIVGWFGVVFFANINPAYPSEEQQEELLSLQT